ncbi:MAG: hypothetical protein LBP79_01375 [Clostridiales bacterium]|nr:hypothetical protein [Clostridiales bacterium]
MSVLEKKAKMQLPILVIFSALFAAAVPGIVIGFVNGWLLMAIPSIIFTVGGVYGLPLGWIGYTNIIAMP